MHILAAAASHGTSTGTEVISGIILVGVVILGLLAFGWRPFGRSRKVSKSPAASGLRSVKRGAANVKGGKSQAQPEDAA